MKMVDILWYLRALCKQLSIEKFKSEIALLKSLHLILAQSENSIIATACPLKFS